MRRRRWPVALLGIAVAAVAAASAVGAGSSPQVEIVRGRIFDYEIAYANGTTRFADLIAENVAPGSNVSFAVKPPCGQAGAIVQRKAPARGIVDFSAVAHSHVLRKGCQAVIRLFSTDTKRQKFVTYTAHDAKPPTARRACTGSNGAAVACSQQCPPAGTAPLDVCQGAGEVAVDSPVVYAYTPARHGFRFQALVATHPAGSIVSLRCRGSSCPVFDKVVYEASAGKTNLAHFLRGAILKAGTTLQVWVERQNEIGKVGVFVVKRSTVSARQLCLPQAALTPERCQ